MGPRLAPVLVLLAVIGTLAVGVRSDDRGAQQLPPVALAAAGDAFGASNSKDGLPILTAPDMNPGQSVTGTVTVGNTGTGALDFTLAQSTPRDTPGPDGGTLSPHLRLTVDDVTGGGARPVYAGSLAGLARSSLGRFAAGESRTYRFTASLPPATGAIDYRAASTSVAYDWQADEAPADPAPDPGEPLDQPGQGTPSAGGASPEPGAPAATAPTPPAAAPRRLLRVVPDRRALRRRTLTLQTRCATRCTATVYASLSIRGKRRAIRMPTRRLRLPAGRTVTLRYRLSRATTRLVLRSLKRKRRVTVRVREVSRDAKGRRTTTRASARLR